MTQLRTISHSDNSFMRAFRRLSVISLGGFLLSSCAVQEAPEGGPLDSTPPAIVATNPLTYSTNFAGDRIVVQFSEYVDERSAEESFFVSPDVGEKEFAWSGTEVELRFIEPLRPGTTYVVTVGTDVQDLHGINMAQSYSLAFSTGAEIDRGTLRGRILPVKAGDVQRGVMIFAWRLSPGIGDTLNPGTTKPDFITQTGTNGTFLMSHLAWGTYRLMAVRDEYRNMLYDRETDDFGVGQKEFVLSQADTMVSGILLQLAKEDTTGPRVVRAVANDRTHVVVEFSENIDTSAVFASIIDTTTSAALTIRSLFPNLPRFSSFTFVTAPMDSTSGYRVTIARARDEAGNSIQTLASSMLFGGSGRRDTTGLRIIGFGVNDSARGVPSDGRFLLQFSDALSSAGSGTAIALAERSGASVPLDITWVNAAAVSAAAKKPLESKTWYTLTVIGHEFRGSDGRVAGDSTRSVRFETVDAEIQGSIEGTVDELDGLKRNGNVLVAAVTVGKKEASSIIRAADEKGAFAFTQIPEGSYLMRAFRDVNGNHRYDTGHPFPYRPSEPLTLRMDTLKVRARWPLEGVKLDLR